VTEKESFQRDHKKGLKTPAKEQEEQEEQEEAF